MRRIPLLALIGLLSCVRSPKAAEVLVAEDPSIVFPDFYGSPTMTVGERDKTYALDGVMLRALIIAAHDFIPPAAEERPCWATLEAHGFQVIRQGDIVFVSIHADPAHCGHQFLMLDAGARYAIGADGRILRRVLGSQSGAPASATKVDAGVGKIFREPGLSTVLKPPGYDTAAHLPFEWRDGGSGPDGGSAPESGELRKRSGQVDGGVLSPGDAGS
jgi:hypothetical protein